jgi:endonuclease/exonuclease/phosphatase (EEP) superfamily protein YafD
MKERLNSDAAFVTLYSILQTSNCSDTRSMLVWWGAVMTTMMKLECMEVLIETLVFSPRQWGWYLRGQQQQPQHAERHRQHLREQRHQQQQIPRHNYKLWQRKLQEAPEQRRLPRGVEQSLELQVGWRVS